jgi:hypothetical protein
VVGLGVNYFKQLFEFDSFGFSWRHPSRIKFERVDTFCAAYKRIIFANVCSCVEHFFAFVSKGMERYGLSWKNGITAVAATRSHSSFAVRTERPIGEVDNTCHFRAMNNRRDFPWGCMPTIKRTNLRLLPKHESNGNDKQYYTDNKKPRMTHRVSPKREKGKNTLSSILMRIEKRAT